MMGFDDYMDQAGLLYNASPAGTRDCGDSAQMTGLLRFGKWLAAPDQTAKDKQQYKLEQELDILTYTEGSNGHLLASSNTEIKAYPGIYVRHPKACYPTWAYNPHCFSRDQQRSITIAMGAMKQKKRLKEILWQQIKRWGWYQNDQQIDGTPITPDFPGLDIVGEYIRAFYMAGLWPVVCLYPLLFFTDLYALAAMMVNFIAWNNPNTWWDYYNSDDDNLIMAVLQAKKALPTPISLLLRKIYKHYRPIAGHINGMNGPASAMTYKHRQETGSPPFASLWVPILTQEL